MDYLKLAEQHGSDLVRSLHCIFGDYETLMVACGFDN